MTPTTPVNKGFTFNSPSYTFGESSQSYVLAPQCVIFRTCSSALSTLSTDTCSPYSPNFCIHSLVDLRQPRDTPHPPCNSLPPFRFRHLHPCCRTHLRSAPSVRIPFYNLLGPVSYLFPTRHFDHPYFTTVGTLNQWP